MIKKAKNRHSKISQNHTGILVLENKKVFKGIGIGYEGFATGEVCKKNNRSDLLEVEQNEYDILSSFLPKQLNEEDTKKICEEIISKVGANSVKDMGKVMGELKKHHADEIDFSKAGALIKQLLNK